MAYVAAISVAISSLYSAVEKVKDGIPSKLEIRMMRREISKLQKQCQVFQDQMHDDASTQCNIDSVIFLSDYPTDFEEDDLREIFSNHGSILCIDLLNRSGRSPYAQIEYSDPIEAGEAIRAKNGYLFEGYKFRVGSVRAKEPKKNNLPVEYSKSSHNKKGQVGPTYCVFVSGLPDSASWKDLKSHMEKVGIVKFARINKEGKQGKTVGTVEYHTYKGSKAAVKQLHQTNIKLSNGDISKINVRKIESIEENVENERRKSLYQFK